jgi:myo-inositol-1(or 4)-monophosphatase
LLAVLHKAEPVLAAMFLPTSQTLYEAQKGGGVIRDGVPVRVTTETDLSNVLCAYGLDATPDPQRACEEARTLQRLVKATRNVRATNCLLDFCYTIDGRLGGVINRSTRIWDIAAPCLALPEAGGRLTDLDGNDLRFDLAADPARAEFGVVGASQALHPHLLALVRPPAEA